MRWGILMNLGVREERTFKVNFSFWKTSEASDISQVHRERWGWGGFFSFQPVWFPCFQPKISCQSQPRGDDRQDQSRTPPASGCTELQLGSMFKLMSFFLQLGTKWRKKINISQRRWKKIVFKDGKWWIRNEYAPEHIVLAHLWVRS